MYSQFRAIVLTSTGRVIRCGRGAGYTLSLLLAMLVIGGCAQEYYTLGDVTRGNAEVKRDPKLEPPFSATVDAGRALPGKSWKATVAGIPDQPVPAQQRRQQVLLDQLQNKRVRIASVDGLSVKQFADVVFNQLLNVPVNIDPTLLASKHKIFLLASGEVSGATAIELVQATLQPHGIAVTHEGNAFTLKPIDAMLSDTPPMILNRSDAETPDDLKPVVQFVALTAIEPNLAHQLLQSVTTKRVKVAALQSANSIVISGPGADVSAAVLAVKTIDVPRYAGSKVATITPTYTGAKMFAAGLTRVLQGEGYTVSATESSTGAIKIVTVDSINAVVVFAQNEKLLNRALYWGQRLDVPADNGGEAKTFIYKVRNMAADHLVSIVTGIQQKSTKGPQVAAGKGASSAQSAIQVAATTGTPDPAADGTPGAAGQTNLLKNVQFVVDNQGNRVLVQGTDADYGRIRPLLEQLDVPTRTVLIEVAIAEISLTSDAKFGAEWLIENLKFGGGTAAVQTLKGLGIGSGGMSFALNAANMQVIVNAMASNNRVQILSTPRIVARSGGLARIEVGTDVPIITAQKAATTSNSGSTDVVQQVEYRKTGVILTVKPIIHGDDRVELELEQELSEAANNPNSAITSPLIINRRVVTQLSVTDGMTAVVGGLFSDSNSRGDSGIPGLKNLPIIGSAFRTDTRSSTKTELLIFLRPYIIGGPREMSDLASALQGRLDLFGRQPVVSIDRILGLNKY